MIDTFSDFLNESAAQLEGGKEFENLIGGILKDSDVIRNVEYKDNVLYVIPIKGLTQIDVSLVMGLLSNQENITKIKKKFKGIQSIKFENISLDV